MWLTPTNLENKAAFKENVKMHILSKRRHVFLDFCVFLKKKVAFQLHFKMGSIQKTDALFVQTVAQPTVNDDELGQINLEAKAYIMMMSENYCHQ